MADYEVITSQSDLEVLGKEILTAKQVAIDTEADSFYHYFDKTCLVQIATRRKTYLVDPLALEGADGLSALGPLFASPDVRKIFHAAEYDIFVLKRDCGFRFVNIFDTMVCAQLLGYPSIGLAALAERHFGVRLPKDEQRSDWSSRPLRQTQLDYAAADVTYLISLSEKLEKDLRKAGRLAWAQEEFGSLTQKEWPEREFDRLGYLRIKGARSLDPKSLSVLRELFLMRDKRARAVDRPPFKILGNRTLLEIAQAQPASLEDLGQIKGITELILRRLGGDLMTAVTRGTRKNHGPIPRRIGNGRRRMDRRTERLATALKKWRRDRAKELGLDPGVLCPNSSLEAIACRNPDGIEALGEVSELKGWFVKAFGGEVLETLQRFATQG